MNKNLFFTLFFLLSALAGLNAQIVNIPWKIADSGGSNRGDVFSGMERGEWGSEMGEGGGGVKFAALMPVKSILRNGVRIK